MPARKTGPITPFGRRLLAILERKTVPRPMTLGDLSGLMGCTRTRAYQLLKVQAPGRELVERVAEALGVDRSELDPDLTPTKNGRRDG